LAKDINYNFISSMNHSTTLQTGAMLGALAVALGAFGAHGLEPTLNALGTKATFELATRYHFYHVFALLATGLLMRSTPHKQFKWAAILFTTGTLFFSGSLYLLALTKVSWIWPVTPAGGMCFIAGWIMLGLGIAKK
jgi:uncharacterized membrane protein YgdD (TMEM256/DUF423 family)